MRFSEAFERDWLFYNNHLALFTFCGVSVDVPVGDDNGKSAKECFYKLDSNGIELPCREPELLRAVIRVKKAINWQIKQWVEGWQDFAESTDYYLKDLRNPPNWIKEAFEAQRRSYWYRKFKEKNHAICARH